ncbi:unnamed protein product [Toxocara canis]|uniref:FBPase domain-containing protein n=1 Tax=Toxocara canis TaxID=6265 RepID=A0A183V3H2_TOXCA|nr:unnamed protein product [Toxocara canis]
MPRAVRHCIFDVIAQNVAYGSRYAEISLTPPSGGTDCLLAAVAAGGFQKVGQPKELSLFNDDINTGPSVDLKLDQTQVNEESALVRDIVWPFYESRLQFDSSPKGAVFCLTVLLLDCSRDVGPCGWLSIQ